MRTGSRQTLALALIALLALAVRIPVLSESLYGDELFTYDDVVGRGFGSMLDVVREAEDNPPLFFAVAWLFAKLGDPTVWLRIPSLVASVATVPLVYAVGARTVGRAGGLIGALLFALSPFAIFYASEARAYGLMALLTVLAVYALLRAVDGGAPRWWGLTAAAAAGALYSHYTALWAVAALGLWSFFAHPEQRRRAVAAFGAAAAAFVPWLATGPATQIEGFEVLFPFDFDHVTRALARAAAGHPFVPLGDVPGRAGLALIAAGAVVAAWAVWRSGGRLRPGSRAVLVGLLAVATPIGNAAYSAVATSIFAPRNLYASVPFACLAAGALLARGRRPWAAVATALVAAGLLVATIASWSDDNRRPPFNEAADSVDRKPGRVAVLNLFPVAGQYRGGHTPLLDSVTAYLDDDSRAREVTAAQLAELVARERPPLLHVIVGQITSLPGDPPPPSVPAPYELVERRSYPGFARVALFSYERR
jgi:4-amino-4-deoxy-L-arabinose transferase-like glycosyltransferase